MWRLFIGLALSLLVAGVGHAQNYGLPTKSGVIKTPTSLASLSDGESFYLDYSDSNEIFLNLGANLNIIKKHARSDSLSAGNTDADAEHIQNLADSFPVFYSLVLLNLKAKRMWKRIYDLYPQHTVVEFHIVAVETNHDGSLQDHLIESFTCSSATKDLCDAGKFSRLASYKVTPWFKEAVAHESSMSHKARH